MWINGRQPSQQLASSGEISILNFFKMFSEPSSSAVQVMEPHLAVMGSAAFLSKSADRAMCVSAGRSDPVLLLQLLESSDRRHPPPSGWPLTSDPESCPGWLSEPHLASADDGSPWLLLMSHCWNVIGWDGANHSFIYLLIYWLIYWTCSCLFFPLREVSLNSWNLQRWFLFLPDTFLPTSTFVPVRHDKIKHQKI